MPVGLIPVCSKYPWTECRFFFFFFLISNICLYTVHIFGPSDKSSFLRSGDDLVYFYIIQNSDNCWTEHCIYAFRYSRKCTTKRQNLIQIVPKPAKTIFFELKKLFPFSLKLSKNTWDPREVIVWKFEGPTSNGLVATALFPNTQTNKQTNLQS